MNFFKIENIWINTEKISSFKLKSDCIIELIVDSQFVEIKFALPCDAKKQILILEQKLCPTNKAFVPWAQYE